MQDFTDVPGHKAYTVKQLADLARVSVRTLHYYDEIGLLTPAYVRDNGYRYYGRAECLRLQQILLYREFDMSLGDIAAILDSSDFDTATALSTHKARMLTKLAHYSQLIGVIDTTLAHIKGKHAMKDETLYAWTSEAKQAQYEAWLIERYGPRMRDNIDIGKARLADLSDAERADAMKKLEDIEADLAGACSHGVSPDSAALEPILARHNEWVAFMWGRPCPPVAYAGLAELYETSPDFVSRYEALAPGLSPFLSAAIKAWAAKH